MKKWEYQKIRVDGLIHNKSSVEWNYGVSSIVNLLDEFGSDGWELATITPILHELDIDEHYWRQNYDEESKRKFYSESVAWWGKPTGEAILIFKRPLHDD